MRLECCKVQPHHTSTTALMPGEVLDGVLWRWALDRRVVEVHLYHVLHPSGYSGTSRRTERELLFPRPTLVSGYSWYLKKLGLITSMQGRGRRRGLGPSIRLGKRVMPLLLLDVSSSIAGPPGLPPIFVITQYPLENTIDDFWRSVNYVCVLWVWSMGVVNRVVYGLCVGSVGVVYGLICECGGLWISLWVWSI